MSDKNIIYPGSTNEAHPELFNCKAMPVQSTTKKPGQLPESMIRQFFEKVINYWSSFNKQEYVSGINFAFSIRSWNCSDSVVFFVLFFHWILELFRQCGIFCFIFLLDLGIVPTVRYFLNYFSIGFWKISDSIVFLLLFFLFFFIVPSFVLSSPTCIYHDLFTDVYLV